MKKVIVFDLWKTLVGEPSTLDGYFPILFKALDGRITKGEVNQAAEKFIMTKPVDLKTGVKKICQYFGVVDSRVSQKVKERWAFSCDNCFAFKESLSVLNELKKDYQLALITNTSKYGWEQVEKKFKLSKYFDLLVLSFEQGAVKPATKLFKYVEKKLPAEEYWMVGDSIKSDITPAQLLGWQTVLIDRQRNKSDKRVVNNLNELNILNS